MDGEGEAFNVIPPFCVHAGKEVVTSSNIKVSDILIIEKVEDKYQGKKPFSVLFVCLFVCLFVLFIYSLESKNSSRLDSSENHRKKWYVLNGWYIHTYIHTLQALLSFYLQDLVLYVLINWMEKQIGS